MPTKRVLFVINTLDVGGAERHLAALVRHLTKNEPEIESRVLTLLPSLHPLRSEIEDAGAPVTCVNRRVYDPRLWLNTVRQIRKQKPDLVQTFLWTADNVAGWAARCARVPVRVGSERGNRQQWRRRPVPARLFARAIDRMLAFPGAARFVTNADFGADLLATWGFPAEKIRVNYSGIEPVPSPPEEWDAREALRVSSKVRMIGCAARLVGLKRVDLLIRAVKALRDEGRDVIAVVMGDGPERAKLGNLARELRVPQAVRFLGIVKRPTDYFHFMDVCALCSDTELFPNAILEAMMCGKPVVASRVGGIPEMIDDGRTGLLFEPGDLTDLIDAFRRVLDDSDLSGRLGEAARREADERFNAERTFETYRQLYRELLFPE